MAGRGSALPLLASPLTVGNVILRNRIVSPPHGTNYPVGGLVTPMQVAYFEERAKGGAALIVAGHVVAWERNEETLSANNPFDPAAVEGLKQVAEAVHRHGALMSAQLHFAGRKSTSTLSRRPALSASPLPDPVARTIPKELETDEIDDLVESFGLAAHAIQSAGWDGVEILAAQGYGLANFLSPQSNRRNDEYGGDLRERTLVVRRVLESVRAAVGSQFLVGVRINGADSIAGGLEVDDAADIARILEDTGRVDYLSISGGGSENMPLWIAEMSKPRGLFVPLARRIRQAVSIPLMVATRIKDPIYAESVLTEGVVDLIGMNRALIADPGLPNKAFGGRFDEIRPCISCNQGCLSVIATGGPMRCTINPEVSRESLLPLVRPSGDSHNVLVIGGGPAGLQAAVTAAEAGHPVTLYERRDVLGGQLRMASRTRNRAELSLVLDYLAKRARALGVDLRVGTEFAGSANAYDSVVVATGSVPIMTGFTAKKPSVERIPGVESPHVLSSWDVLEERASVGTNVVVIDDDPHGQAVNVADYLADHGHAVTLICRAPTIGFAYGIANLEPVYRNLYGAGVTILENTWVDRIAVGSVEASNIYTERSVGRYAADTVVIAAGNEVCDELYTSLRLTNPLVNAVRVGDCLAPRRLDDAIWDGYEAGRSVGAWVTN